MIFCGKVPEVVSLSCFGLKLKRYLANNNNCAIFPGHFVIYFGAIMETRKQPTGIDFC